MPDAYLFKADDYPDASRYGISYGDPAYAIGRLICPGCGEHAAAPYRYSDFDVAQFDASITGLLISHDPRAPYRSSRRGPGELTLDQLRALSARLAPILGPDRPFGPFTEFGPHKARAAGKFSDFNWVRPYGPVFVRRSVFETLKTAGFGLSGIAAEIQYRRERVDPLVELQIPPLAHSHPSQHPRTCKTCGYFKCRPRDVPLDAERFDPAVPISCVFEQPYLFVVNAAMGDFIRERKLTGAILTSAKFK